MKRSSVFSILFLLSIGVCFAIQADAKKTRHTNKGSVVEKIADEIDEALVMPPVDDEVCFSPEEPCDIKLIKFIESATRSIDVAIYDINLDGLVEVLLKKAKTILVRIIVDQRQAKGQHSKVQRLIDQGAIVRFGNQRGIFHNKMVIIDGNRVETGSFNFTRHAAKSNNENQVYLSTPKIVARYQSRFDHLWEKAKISNLRN